MALISVAHSPDADDIFMYYAVKFGWATKSGFAFENTALDIETLNVSALKAEFDICAISFALYPHIRESYALLRTAMSFGDGYGPKLIKKKGTHLKKRFKVALSGKYTTNAMLFRIAYPDARIVYKNFLDIEAAVLSGEVDAGVLIHESILEYDESLEVEREIWDIWAELAKEELPLPLGGMALRRSIPILRAIECEEMLTDAVRVARLNAPLLSRMLYERGLIRVNETNLKKYLTLYANEESQSLTEKGVRAIDKLFRIGYENGYFDELIAAKEYMIPTEYKELRFS